jgi:transposase
MQGKKEYQEQVFVHFQLSDRVPKDNLYRRLKEELDLEFLRSLTKDYYGTEGQKSIDPVVFFKLILVGYLENLNSDRKIVEHASVRMDVLYFLNYDINEPFPWHSTVSRTRQLYGEEVFIQLFQKVLKMCVDKGMVSGRRQALDSAYIKANASLDSILEKEVMDDAEIFAEELANNDTSTSLSTSGTKKKQEVTYLRKKKVEAHHAWKAEQYKEQHKLSKEQKESEGKNSPKFLSNHTHYSTTDPDARISTKPGKPRQLNYSAQTSVDTSHHVITNIMADYSDKRDNQSLIAAVKQTKENLELNGLKLEELLADTGYSGGGEFDYLEKENITGYIPNHGQYKPEREGFIYNEELDQYECQRGLKAILPYKGTNRDALGYDRKSYRSSAKVCKHCPLLKQCAAGKAKYKKLEHSIHKKQYDKMHARLQSKYAKRMKKLRSSTVEPVLGTLINFRGMRRIWTRGIKSANKFMIGAAIAYNLKKYMKFKPKKVNVQVAELPNLKTKLNKPIQTYFFAI